ncbi:hypothetical protein Tco_1310225 [Tanacetum coccineum]
MLLEISKLIKNNRIIFNSDIFPHEEMSMRVLLAKERILKLIQDWDEKQIKPWSLPELLLQLFNDSRTINEILKQRKEKRIEREQAANLAVQKKQEEQEAQSFTPYWNFPIIDDDEEYTIQYREYLERSSNAITHDLPNKEPEYSLSMGDEHLSTISEMKSDEVIKSSVENLVPIPSESEVTSDNKNTLIDSSPKFDYLLEEFSGELVHIDLIPPGIEKADFDLEEEIRLVDNLSYDNSSPRPPEELNAEIAYTITESLFLPLIPVEDSDSRMEEIDLFLAFDDLMPPGIENDDYDSEGDIRFLEELLNDDLVSLAEYNHFTFDIEPDTAVKNDFDELNKDECFDPGGGEIDVFSNVEDNDYFPFTFFIRIFLPYLTYPEVSPLLLLAGSEDTIFDPGIST